jgi:hypothetical protein
MQKFTPLIKADESSHTVHLLLTRQEKDRSGEIFDYQNGGKAAVKGWMDDFHTRTTAASQDPSFGNVRVQHDAARLGGKIIARSFDDADKSIPVTVQVLDEVWPLVEGGILTGGSIAGSYQSRACSVCHGDMMDQLRSNFCPSCAQNVPVLFVPQISEFSLVDNPCVASSTFQYVRSDGISELRKFAKEATTVKISQHFESAAKFHRACGKAESIHAESHRQLASLSEKRADPAAVAIHKNCAAAHETMAAAHAAHADQCAALANGGPDVWGVAERSVDTEGNSAKVAEGFFAKYFADSGMFGNRLPRPDPILTDPRRMFE